MKYINTLMQSSARKKAGIYVLFLSLLLSSVGSMYSWDNEHFVDYTSNALTNTVLASTALCSAYLLLASDEPSVVALGMSFLVSSSCLGVIRAYYANKSENVSSSLKKSINALADILLLTSIPLAASRAESLKMPAVVAVVGGFASSALWYVGKYALFNQPASQSVSIDTVEDQ